MNPSMQWFESAQISLQEGQIYAAVREFNSGVFRLLANKSSTPSIELKVHLAEFLRLLGEKKLFHEIDQIFENYFKHYRKLNLSTEYILLLLDLPEENMQHDIILIIFKKVLAFCQGNIQQNVFKEVFDVFEIKLKIWHKSLELTPEQYIFVKNVILMQIRIQILKRNYSDALSFLESGLTDKIVLDEELIIWIIFQAYLLSIIGKNNNAINILQEYRKTKDKNTLGSFFEVGSDLILSIRADDQEWFVESREIASKFKFEDLNEPLYPILMNELLIELQKKYFPNAPKTTLLGNFL